MRRTLLLVAVLVLGISITARQPTVRALSPRMVVEQWQAPKLPWLQGLPKEGRILISTTRRSPAGKSVGSWSQRRDP
jgi:hypothetical protein